MSSAQVIGVAGIYEIPAAAYHADPCIAPSLSSTGARAIMSTCPAKFWHDRNHPASRSKALDIGSAAHEWILEGDAWPQRHAVLPEDHNGTTKAGKARIAAIQAEGLIPLRHDEFAAIRGMRDALFAHDLGAAAFSNGRPELSLFWQDEEFGIWCRARPDWTPNRGTIFPDFKTTRSAEPGYLTRAIFDYGYHQQAAWYLDGIRATGLCARPAFLLVFQEKTPPYLVTCVAPSEAAVEWGRMLNRKAKEHFARGIETGQWPGYADDVVTLDLPGWAERQLQARHDAGLLETAMRMQAPLAAE